MSLHLRYFVTTTKPAAAVDYAAKVVTDLCRQRGGSMHYLGQELERLNRDMLVLAKHSTGDVNYAAESSGRVLLGQGLQKRSNVFF